MHKLESVLPNAKHKIIWDFKIKMDLLIPARRPDLVIVEKKKRELDIPTDHREKKKRKERQVLRPCQRTMKAVKH